MLLPKFWWYCVEPDAVGNSVLGILIACPSAYKKSSEMPILPWFSDFLSACFLLEMGPFLSVLEFHNELYAWSRYSIFLLHRNVSDCWKVAHIWIKVQSSVKFWILYRWNNRSPPQITWPDVDVPLPGTVPTFLYTFRPLWIPSIFGGQFEKFRLYVL